MKVSYSVTFEFITQPPLTHTGVVVAYGVATCASRAVKQAQKAVRAVGWSSVVCVLLERLDEV